MQTNDARSTLETLVQGFDPTSGAALPTDHVMRQSVVMSALLAAITALETEALRARRRAHLPQNVGRPWSESEQGALMRAFQAGQPLAAIAAQHHRTLAAIEARLESLGLITAAQRRTRNRYVTRAADGAARRAVPALGAAEQAAKAASGQSCR